MQCRYCGYTFADDLSKICPYCGRYQNTATMPKNLAGPSVPETPEAAQGLTPSVPPPNPVPPTSAPSNPPGVAQPGVVSGSPPSYPPGYLPYPPSYAQPGAPTEGNDGYQGSPGYPGYPGYPSGYAQPGMPYPVYPGYPPGYSQPGAPSQGYPQYPGYPTSYGQPGSPPTPPKKTNIGTVIVSLVLSVLVVAGLLTAGLLTLSQAQKNSANNSNGSSSIVSTTGDSSTPTPGTSSIFTDPLTSDAYGWSNDQHCFFRSDGYHISGDWQCYAPVDVPNNFTAQVRVKQVSGSLGSAYGMVFRRASEGNEYYFLIDGYGHWSVAKCVNQNCSGLQGWSSSGGSINQGLNAQNTIEVSATGSDLVFFANGKRLGQVSDSAFSSGIFGLAGSGSTEVVYTDLVINQVV